MAVDRALHPAPHHAPLHDPARPLAQRLARCLLAAVMVFAAGVVLLRAGGPAERVLRHLILDDGIYYAIPARHFVEGAGFSFDGLARTSGVNPLWAMVVTGLAWLVHDDLALLRVMSGLGGALWIAAALGVFHLLRPVGPLGGSLAATGFVFAGLEQNFAGTGMEAGLNAALLVAAVRAGLAVAADPADDPSGGPGRRATRFGLAAALLSLCRIEYGLLAALWGAWLAARIWRQPPAADRWRPLLRFLVPLLVLGGAWTLTSRLYFGEWTPISGSVKALIATTNPHPHGGLGASFQHHVVLAATLAVSSFLFAAIEGLVALRAAPAPAVLPALTSVATLGRWRERIAAAGRGAPALLLAPFVAVHLLLVSLLLAPFTGYCTWYFTCEMVAVWLVLGSLWARADRRFGGVLLVPAAVLVVGTAWYRVPALLAPPAATTSATGDLVDVGRWCRHWLPPGSTIGAWNAGFVSWSAEGLTTVNLDGLMNDGRFLCEYLATDRLDAYIRERGITYLADCQPAAMWRDCERGAGRRLPAGLQPLFCEPALHGTVRAVLAVPGADGTTGAPPAPLAAVMWRAFVRGDLPTAAPGELRSLPSDRQVIATCLEPATGTVRHVHATRAEAPGAIAAAGIGWRSTARAAFAEGIELLGVDLPVTTHAGRTALVTTYWRRGDGAAAPAELRFRLQGERGIECLDAPAHGTLPMDAWAIGTVIAHTFVVAVPADARGDLGLRLGLQGRGGIALRSLAGAELTRIGALTVMVR
jgi:hypothetical protein